MWSPWEELDWMKNLVGTMKQDWRYHKGIVLYFKLKELYEVEYGEDYYTHNINNNIH